MGALESVYDLYQRGRDLLDQGDHHAAIVALSRARDLDPDKASIREALGRALFHAQRYGHAAEEFRAVTVAAPTNDYALFCLGRSMQLLGRHREACKPLALACSLRPERADYRVYRDRARRDAERP
jgi:tetratricopeptide (TPR) repeat protein